MPLAAGAPDLTRLFVPAHVEAPEADELAEERQLRLEAWRRPGRMEHGLERGRRLCPVFHASTFL